MDPAIIRELYAASEAGVHRSHRAAPVVCDPACRPKFQNHRAALWIVSSEHSRIFCFDNVCRPGSLQQCRLDATQFLPSHQRRPFRSSTKYSRAHHIRVVCPALADNMRARRLTATGTYQMEPLKPDEQPREPVEFIELAARKSTVKSVSRNGESRYRK